VSEKKPKPPAIPYHELFPLNEGESPDDFSPLPPDQIKILVRRYEPTGIKRAQRLYSGIELKDMTSIGKRWGMGLYELEARTVDGRFYRRVSYDIDGDPPKPLDPPSEIAAEVNAQQAQGMLASPDMAMMQNMGNNPMGMFMWMMQRADENSRRQFEMMMHQQTQSTQLLAAVLSKPQGGTDPAISAVISSLTELQKTRLEIDSRAGMPQSPPATPEQELARLNALIDFAKKLNPGVPAESITQTVKELWPMFQPTVGPILAKIIEMGASAAKNGVVAASSAPVPLPAPVAPPPG
jgi:hypothetical protein